MTSSSPHRRIACHRLLLDGRWFFRAWVEVDGAGRVVARGVWDDLDRMPCTEFYGGILLCGHYEIRMETFMKEGLALAERLSTLRRTEKTGLTLVEGIDLRTDEPLRPRLRRIV